MCHSHAHTMPPATINTCKNLTTKCGRERVPLQKLQNLFANTIKNFEGAACGIFRCLCFCTLRTLLWERGQSIEWDGLFCKGMKGGTALKSFPSRSNCNVISGFHVALKLSFFPCHGFQDTRSACTMLNLMETRFPSLPRQGPSTFNRR